MGNAETGGLMCGCWRKNRSLRPGCRSDYAYWTDLLCSTRSATLSDHEDEQGGNKRSMFACASPEGDSSSAASSSSNARRDKGGATTLSSEERPAGVRPSLEVAICRRVPGKTWSRTQSTASTSSTCREPLASGPPESSQPRCPSYSWSSPQASPTNSKASPTSSKSRSVSPDAAGPDSDAAGYLWTSPSSPGRGAGSPSNRIAAFRHESLDDIFKVRRSAVESSECTETVDEEGGKLTPRSFKLSLLQGVSQRERSFLSIGLLFPNQGCEHVGMLGGSDCSPTATELLKKAKSILGYDVHQLCSEGPASTLAETRHCQPAVYVTAVLATESLRARRREAVEECMCVAGIGVGEYAALTAAGVLDFECGLSLVRTRAEAMEAAASEAKSMAIRTVHVTGVKLSRAYMLCKEAQAGAGADHICQVSSSLVPGGVVCTGTEEAIARLQKQAEAEASAVDRERIGSQTSRDKLSVRRSSASGRCSVSPCEEQHVSVQSLDATPFQTRLMAPAQARLHAALQEALPELRPPRCAVYFNSTGMALPAGAPPAKVVSALVAQVSSPVLWDHAVRQMVSDGVEEFYELGPAGGHLKDLMRQIDKTSWRRMQSVTAC